MSAEIVNLRRARKAKLRAAGDDQAATNRLVFGRTRNERELQVKETARTERVLDGHRVSAPDIVPRPRDGG